MSMAKMMANYGTTDRERFPSWDSETHESRPDTTFWADFSVAEGCYPLDYKKQIAAIKDTWERAFDGWKDNYKYFTELALVLNHKLWYWYEQNGDCALSRCYDALWRMASDHSYTFKGDAARHYCRVTD